MNRKGMADQIIIAVVLVGVLLFMMVAFWAWTMIAPTATALLSDTSQMMITAGAESDDGNISTALSIPFTAVGSVVSEFEWITYGFLFALVIGFIILCFMVRTYPFLLGFWIIGIIILAVISIFLTSAYQDATYGTDYIATASQSWTTSHYIMNNFPIIVVAVGLIGGIILFSLISKDSNIEESKV